MQKGHNAFAAAANVRRRVNEAREERQLVSHILEGGVYGDDVAQVVALCGAIVGLAVMGEAAFDKCEVWGSHFGVVELDELTTSSSSSPSLSSSSVSSLWRSFV